MLHKILILVLLFSQNFSFSQSYFPPANQSWETKNPKVFNLKKATLDNAIDFAKSNEYSGERDLRIAILKGFAKEPYHQILGPTKKRGGPAGIILKNGYQIASWGETKSVDMTFSVTKSYLSTVAGLAVDRGFFKPTDTVA
ncbi:MAG: serine hydrolase, partial [Flavobacteriaceae bacterium]|nr:serine hydrolase [Flavobacteriaceae bacterium]